MKKILSLILIALIFPCVFVLSACGKDGGYKLSNLKSDFVKIAEDHEMLVEKDGKFEFVYSTYTNEDDKYMENILANNNLPYKEIKNYNILFDNAMSFAYSNIEICSSDSVEVDENLRNSIKNKLDELNKNISEVQRNLDSLADVLKFSLDDELNNFVCLSSYKFLLSSYQDLYQSAINFNDVLTNLYYNYMLQDSNPNVYNIEEGRFNANIVVGKFKSRVESQISSLSKLYLEKHVLGQELVVDDNGNNKDFGALDLNKENYTENVNILKSALNNIYSSEVSIETAIEVANGSSNLNKFYNKAIEIYNIQEVLSNDLNKFLKASSEIEYFNILTNLQDSSAYEKMSIKIIDDYNFLIQRYQVAMVELLEIMGA